MVNKLILKYIGLFFAFTFFTSIGFYMSYKLQRRRKYLSTILLFLNRLQATITFRKDDIEEKRVVVPDGVTFSKEEIRRQIHFQEQYFDSEIVM